jgi:CRP-like cAMP-binding protein
MCAMSSLDARRNRLLAALEPSDLALLSPHLRLASFAQGTILQQEESPSEQVYFPLTGMLSLVAVMRAGEIVETATVGREGMLGAFTGSSFARGIVQVPMGAAVVSATRLQAIMGQSARVRNLILRYQDGLLCQVQQMVACTALHPLDARLARWLLHALDRADGPDLPVTHDAIAQMLAVSRTTVTLVATQLQDTGLIRQHRGRLVILDRAAIEELACECYETIRRQMDRILLPASSTAVGHRRVAPKGVR